MSTDCSGATSSSNNRCGLHNHFRVTLLGVACVAFGLLIWSRLLLVTNYPKSAIAEPTGRVATRSATASATPAD